MDKSSRIGPLVAALGLGSALGLYGVFLWGGPLLFSGTPDEAKAGFYAIVGLMGSLIGFLARPISVIAGVRLRFLYDRIAPVLGAIGLVLFACEWWRANSVALFITGFFLGFSVAALFMFWIRYIARFTPMVIRRILLAEIGVSAAYNFALAILARNEMLNVLCLVMGSVAILCQILVAAHKPSVAHESRAMPLTVERYQRSFRALVGPLACASALLLIAPSIHYVALEDGLDWHLRFFIVCIGQLISVIVSVVLLKVFKSLSRMISVFVGTAPLLLGSLFLFPFLGVEYRYILLIVGSSLHFIVFILIMIDCIDISREHNCDVMVLYGVCGSVTFLSTYVGGQIMGSVAQSGVPRDIQMVATAFFLIYILGLVLLFVQNKLKEKPALELDAKDSTTPCPNRTVNWSVDGRERACCRYIQITYELSDREMEVLEKILHGRNAPAIAEELFISQNTVRTHVKKIYRALKVHSRQELLNRFERLFKEFDG